MPKNNQDTILQLYARTPAPCRDYCGLTITKEKIILNVWNITFGPHVYPKRVECLLEALDDCKSVKVEIERVFGRHVLEYVNSLSRNETKLETLSTKAFLSILNYLAAKDILNLSQTSKIMFEVMFKCRKVFKTRPSQSDLLRAEEDGWRSFLKEKLRLKDSIKGQNRDVARPIANNRKIENKPKLGEVKSAAYVKSAKPLSGYQSKSLANVSASKHIVKTLPLVKNELRSNLVQSCNLNKSTKPKLVVPETKNFKSLM